MAWKITKTLGSAPQIVTAQYDMTIGNWTDYNWNTVTLWLNISSKPVRLLANNPIAIVTGPAHISELWHSNTFTIVRPNIHVNVAAQCI